MSAEKIRLEIVGNNALEDDLIDYLEAAIPGIRYTILGEVRGSGSCGKRLGDGVWPELNFQLLLNLTREEADLALASVKEIKRRYPNEGLKAWSWVVSEEV